MGKSEGLLYTAPAPSRSRGAPALRRLAESPEVGLVALLIAAVAGFSIAAPEFLSGSTIDSILRATAFVGIMAVGQAMLLVSGEFDLSVGSVASLGAVVGATLMSWRGWPWPVALVGAGAVGALTGAINGFLTAYVRIPALVVTLGMLYVARGASLVVSDGLSVDVPDSYEHFGRAEPVLGLPWLVLIFFFCVAAGELALRRATYGRRLYAVGGNARASELAGVSPRATKLAAFVVVGVMAALAGALLVARLGTADPTVGNGNELTVIAAAVVGGVSLFGGVGTVLGAFLGALLLQVINTGLVVVGVQSSWQPVATGALLIGAIALHGRRKAVQPRGGA